MDHLNILNSKFSSSVIHFLVFFGTLLLSVYVIEKNLRDVPPNNEQISYYLRYAELYDPKVAAKNIVIGSSSGVHGINPLLLIDNNKTYNFSFNGANPEFIYNLYINVISKNYTKPEIVIYAVSPSSFSTFLNRNNAEDLIYVPKSAIQTLSVINRVKKLYFEFRLFHSNSILHDLLKLRNLGENRTAKDNFLDVSLYGNGFVPYSRDYFKNNVNPPLEHFDINQKQVEYFDKLISYLRKMEIKVIIVGMPIYTPSYYKDEVSNFDKLVNEITKTQNVVYINYKLNKELNTNQLIFSDSSHLNFSGAKTLTQLLTNDLRASLLYEK